MERTIEKWSAMAEEMRQYLLRELESTGAEWANWLEMSLRSEQELGGLSMETDKLEGLGVGCVSARVRRVLGVECKARRARRALDVGCGTGFLSILLARQGWDVIAIDSNSSMIEKARRTAEELALSERIHFAVQSAEKTDFDESTFDAIVSRDSFWLFPEPHQVYREWHRVLRPGGILLNIDSNWMQPYWNEACSQLFREDEARLVRLVGEFRDFYHDTAMMEEFRHLPLAFERRPEWDKKALEALGYDEIQLDTLCDQTFRDPFYAVRYRSMPTFVIRARKPR